MYVFVEQLTEELWGTPKLVMFSRTMITSTQLHALYTLNLGKHKMVQTDTKKDIPSLNLISCGNPEGLEEKLPLQLSSANHFTWLISLVRRITEAG